MAKKKGLKKSAKRPSKPDAAKTAPLFPGGRDYKPYRAKGLTFAVASMALDCLRQTTTPELWSRWLDDGAPFSIECFTCDSDRPASIEEAVDLGWSRFQLSAEGSTWLLGHCPQCRLEEMAEDLQVLKRINAKNHGVTNAGAD